MSKLPLVENLRKYIGENTISFCTPGHKSGVGFLGTEEGKWMNKNLIHCDITEVEGMDNLHHPEGIIKEAAELLSNFYGSKKSYFLVNGSTSGNLAMIFSSFEEGDKIIVERNCHRSILNGIILRKLIPIYIKNRISDKYNAPFSIDMEHFSCLLKANTDVKGIVLTYPNYYGICFDLGKVINEAKKYNMKVLIDSAHGAHFGVSDKLPESAVRLGADMVVMSAHKTLPSVTQTAYLHVGQDVDLSKVDFYVSAFLSTSPSYMFLCSMDYARLYLDQSGKVEYERLLDLAEQYRNKINLLKNFFIMGREEIKDGVHDIDLTRFVIHLKNGHNGHELLKYLRERGIQGEMSDESNVILILSPFYGEAEFEILYKALKDYKPEQFTLKYANSLRQIIPNIKLLPYEAIGKKRIRIKIKEALGKICGESIVPYPPGVPLIMPGEIIDEEIIEIIEYYKRNKVTILGLEGEELLIVGESIRRE